MLRSDRSTRVASLMLVPLVAAIALAQAPVRDEAEALFAAARAGDHSREIVLAEDRGAR